MFAHKRSVYLRETDTTGVIYFGALLQYGLEAFEEFLLQKGHSLSQIFDRNFLMPIVHTEADYKAPLRVGDELLVELGKVEMGRRSFSIQSKVFKMPDRMLAGTTKFVHAFLRKGDSEASEIPQEILEILSGLN